MRQKFRIGNYVEHGVSCQPDKTQKSVAHIHRYFHLEKPTGAATGKLLTDNHGQDYILIHDRTLPNYEVYIGLIANVTLDMIKMDESTHPVTGLMTRRPQLVPTPTPACLEQVEAQDDKGFNVQVSRYYVAGVLDADTKVNGKTIKNLQTTLGITQFEIA